MREPAGFGPVERRCARVIAFINPKGGSGKTTTSVNLAGCLADLGQRVLVVDVDPQGHASASLGARPGPLDDTLYDVLAEPIGHRTLEGILRPVGDRIELAPSGPLLSALEPRLARQGFERRSEHLAAALDPLRTRYDFVLIDCPPSLGVLSCSAYRAATEIILPLEPSPWTIDAARRLLENFDVLARRLGHRPRLWILPVRFDGRSRFARNVLASIRSLDDEACLDTVVRANVKLQEAAQRGLPISRFAASSMGAQDHATLALEMVGHRPAALDGAMQRDGSRVPSTNTAVGARRPPAAGMEVRQ